MPRPAKIWWRSERNEWCVKIGNVRHRLGPNKAEAERRFHELKSKPKGVPVSSDSVLGIFESFMDWCQKQRDESTAEWYRRRIQSFIDSLKDKQLTVEELKPHHVHTWIESKAWGDGMKRGAMTAVIRAFHWASKMGYIGKNPIKGIEKPDSTRREVVISEDEYGTILRFVQGPFRDAIVTAWETGCRPEELVKVEARHVILKDGCWEFPAKEAKGKKKKRTVYLTDTAFEITKRLMEEHPKGPLFRSERGKPWNGYLLNNAFRRLQADMGKAKAAPVKEKAIKARMKAIATSRKKKGKSPIPEYDLRSQARVALEGAEARKHAPKYFLYAFRHSYITHALKRGVDPVTLAALVGHSDLAMIQRVYSHISQDAAHMRKMAKLAVG